MTAEKTQKAGWQRIGKLYQTIAVIGFNTLVFLVATVAVINWVIPPKQDAAANKNEVVAVGVNATYSTYFNRNAYYLSTPDEVVAMLADYDAMAHAGHWMVHPWTGLTMRPFRSHYLNIDKNGLRAGVPVDAAHDGQSPLVVWAFGGSTLFGWGLADNYSIPSLLQIELQKRLPNRQVRVQNFAVPIYNSSQELALFAANLRDHKPDIAFFFDGINDLWFTLNANTQTPLVDPLAEVWEKNTYSITHPQQENWITVNPIFPPLRLAQALGLPLGQPPPDSPSAQYAMHGIYEPTHEEQLAAAVHNYVANRQMADAIGTAMGVKTFFFLQPFLTDKVDFPIFRTQVAAATAMTNYVDISTLLDGQLPAKRKALIDNFHYSDYASELIAVKLTDILMVSAN